MADPFEETRAKYRPARMTTLFIGESAPTGGTFFYYGNSQMMIYMQRATQSVLGGTGDYLDRFRAYGWFLDDLVLTPVDSLPFKERSVLCRGAQNSLAERIAEYRPLAIVSLLIGISKIVDAAARAAGTQAPLFRVPFPGNGQKNRFHEKITAIIPALPREAPYPE